MSNIKALTVNFKFSCQFTIIFVVTMGRDYISVEIGPLPIHHECSSGGMTLPG
jgi:hypothetical protein